MSEKVDLYKHTQQVLTLCNGHSQTTPVLAHSSRENWSLVVVQTERMDPLEIVHYILQ